MAVRGVRVSVSLSGNAGHPPTTHLRGGPTGDSRAYTPTQHPWALVALHVQSTVMRTALLRAVLAASWNGKLKNEFRIEDRAMRPPPHGQPPSLPSGGAAARPVWWLVLAPSPPPRRRACRAGAVLYPELQNRVRLLPEAQPQTYRPASPPTGRHPSLPSPAAT